MIAKKISLLKIGLILQKIYSPPTSFILKIVFDIAKSLIENPKTKNQMETNLKVSFKKPLWDNPSPFQGIIFYCTLIEIRNEFFHLTG